MSVFHYSNYNLDKYSDKQMKELVQRLNYLRENAEGGVDNARQQLKGFIDCLHILDLYPVWSMPSHRRTYYFPTEMDCEMWQDWLDGMREDG